MSLLALIPIQLLRAEGRGCWASAAYTLVFKLHVMDKNTDSFLSSIKWLLFHAAHLSFVQLKLLDAALLGEDFLWKNQKHLLFS